MLDGRKPLLEVILECDARTVFVVLRADARMDGLAVFDRKLESTGGRADGGTEGRKDGRTDGRADGQTDGQTDGRAGSHSAQYDTAAPLHKHSPKCNAEITTPTLSKTLIPNFSTRTEEDSDGQKV